MNSRVRLSAALMLVAVLSFFLWWEFRLRTPVFTISDTYRYLANGLSLLDARHPFVEPQPYAEFSNHAAAPLRVAAYPNQLYSLSIAGLIRIASAHEGRLVLWPIWIPDMAATVIGFCFLFLLFRHFLPEPDVWLGMAVLGFHSLLMASLIHPLADAAGWCFAMALFWFAICRSGSPWALGAAFGLALLFRLQLLILFPFILALAQRSSCPRKVLTGSLKATAAMIVVVLLFEGGMKLYVQLPPGADGDSTFGSATFYVRDFSIFIAQYGRIPRALDNFAGSLLALFRPVDCRAIGLPLLLSLAVWWGKNDTLLQKQARLLWMAAFAGSLLPLLVYASENNPVPQPRYQIYSIPVYVLVALFSLNRLGALFAKRYLCITLKGLLVILTVAGCVKFTGQSGLSRPPVYGSLEDVFAELENLPHLLVQRNMPPDGRYLVKATMQAFLPNSHEVLLPAIPEFRTGQRNHELDGLILRRKGDWRRIGPVIEDDRGVRFLRVYAGSGKGELLIYKREPSSQ